jgi:hypothetical protein
MDRPSPLSGTSRPMMTDRRRSPGPALRLWPALSPEAQRQLARELAALLHRMHACVGGETPHADDRR